MSMLGAWFRGPAKAAALSHTQALDATEEAKYLEDAMAAVSLIMEENIEGAEENLKAGDSSFHKLGVGVTVFMRALLGFEPEVIKTASERLADAEATIWADMKRVQKDSGAFRSKIYPPGTEFALCYSESMLMSAVVAVLNENLIESMKGFYKMRKAFITLDGIMEVEHKYMSKLDGVNDSSNTSLSIAKGDEKHMPGGFDDDEFLDLSSAPITRNSSATKISGANGIPAITLERPASDNEDDSELEFVDADEAHSGAQTPASYGGHVTSNGNTETQMKDLHLSQDSTSENSDQEPSVGAVTPAQRRNINLSSDSDAFSNPIDVFIHSGTNLCYGLMLLIISMVPPAFSKLLAIIGFKGDRDRGVRMLWQSTKFSNINGCVAGLVLLGYYNGLQGFSDILMTESDASTENVAAYPRARCEALLADMRSRYPGSRLWRLEEARMQSGKRDLRGAIKLLSTNVDSPMKQVKALNLFEYSLDLLWAHEYQLAADNFRACVKVNGWSRSLYTYIAGCAHAELFRDLRGSDPEKAQKHKEKATRLIRKAPTLAGKKRFMAKQMPFDVYVTRKVQKWEERAKEWEVDLIEAIGVSPVEEMIYLWNGYKRMDYAELEVSLKKLEWGRTIHPEKHTTNLDEVAIQALLRSAALRNLGRYEEARKMLQENILNHEAPEFKGHLRDDWPNPSAHYEMAVIAWFEKDLEGADTAAKVTECEEWLQKVSKWESYVLDTRIGLKITTAVNTIKMYKQQQ